MGEGPGTGLTLLLFRVATQGMTRNCGGEGCRVGGRIRSGRGPSKGTRGGGEDNVLVKGTTEGRGV